MGVSEGMGRWEVRGIYMGGGLEGVGLWEEDRPGLCTVGDCGIVSFIVSSYDIS